MGSYDEYYERSKNEFIRKDDEDIHYHNEHLKRARDICAKISSPISESERRLLLSELFGLKLPDSVEINIPFNCDVGYNISFKESAYINYGCIFLDFGHISIGNNVLIGPGVKIIAADHPKNPEKRLHGETIAKDVIIEDNVWLGANSVILAGVTVGEGSIVGAGAVVTKNVEPRTIVAGVPAKKINDVY